MTGKALMSPEEAARIVREHIRPGRVECVRLEDALHRTLAEAVACDVDYPPFDRALMDGYAVRADDVRAAPVTLKVVGDIAAGHAPLGAVGPGEAMRINTGAPVPPGADAIVRVEDTAAEDGGRAVRILKSATTGQFITPQASYVRAGDMTLSAGMRLGPLEIAVAATSGAAKVCVYAAPRVAIVVTGDELIEPGRKPVGAQIRNSNAPLLTALVREAQAIPIMTISVRDVPGEIRAAIGEALERCDVLCLTGGVSAGEYDFVPGIVAELGCRTHFHKVAIKPGRPTLFATSPGGQGVFGLPGNPISAFIGFHLFVAEALARLQGHAAAAHRTLSARLIGRLPEAGARCSFIPAKLTCDAAGAWRASPQPWQGSGDPFGMAGADALIVREAGTTAATDGSIVTVRLLPHWTCVGEDRNADGERE